MKHLDNFEPREHMHNFKEVMIANIMDPMKDLLAVLKNGEVICIVGANHLRLGVVEVWLIASDKVESCKFEFFKTIKRLIDFVFETMGVHRLEIAVDCNWQQGGKWAQALGLKFESIARSYDHMHRDHAIYVRIEKCQ